MVGLRKPHQPKDSEVFGAEVICPFLPTFSLFPALSLPFSLSVYFQMLFSINQSSQFKLVFNFLPNPH